MRCCNCDENNWMNVDEMRIKPSGMSICKNCGFVSYPDKWKSEEDLKKFYKADYRRAPTVGNYHTGQKKLSYHEAFLGEYLNDWKSR